MTWRPKAQILFQAKDLLDRATRGTIMIQHQLSGQKITLQ